MARKKSKRADRQDRILAALDADPSIRVSELSARLGVSSETIRRDLSDLDEVGKLTRTYGGAVRSQGFEPALAERLKQKVGERQAIAQEAIKHIEGAEYFFISGGSTALHFARALRKSTDNLIVVTPSYSIASQLSSNPRIWVMMLQGMFDGSEGIVHGPETVAAVERVKAPLAVLSVSGLDANGLSEGWLVHAHVIAAMVAHSKRTIVMADSAKFDRRAFVEVCPWGPNLHLITDIAPQGIVAAAIKKAGTKVTIVDPRSNQHNEIGPTNSTRLHADERAELETK